MDVTIDELKELMKKASCAGEVVGRMLDFGRELLLVARSGELSVDEKFVNECAKLMSMAELHNLRISPRDELRLIVEDDNNFEKEKRRYYILLSRNEALNSTLIRTLGLQVCNGEIVVNGRKK